MTAPAQAPQLFPTKKPLRIALLAVLFATALGLRLAGISAPMTEFHPMRQYRAAIIARNLYFESDPGAAPDWRREVAAANAAQEEVLEPRLLENLAALLYQAAGGEYVWLPRLFSVACWLIGGGLLFRLGNRLLSEDAALIATTFYLLAPFGVPASRVFQPDPLMIMLYLLGLNVIVWYDEQPSWRNLIVTGVVCAAAPLVKAISVFTLFFAFAGLSFWRKRSWRGLINARVTAFGALLALPMAIYYISGILAQTGLHSEAQTDILPQLWLTRVYWGGWFTQIGKALGPLVFLAALVGPAIMREEKARFLIFGVLVGYVIMGLTFTYTIHTHDYYQLQLFAITGLCLSPLITPITARIRSLFTTETTLVIFAALLVVILGLFSAYENWWRMTFRYFYENTDPVVAKVGPEVGEAVGHSTHVIVLAAADGRPLRYYAEIAGPNWPTANEFGVSQLLGAPLPGAKDYLAQLEKDQPADYFVVTDLAEFNRQPELKRLLDSAYPIAAQAPNYVIYDLKHPLR